MAALLLSGSAGVAFSVPPTKVSVSPLAFNPRVLFHMLTRVHDAIVAKSR